MNSYTVDNSWYTDTGATDHITGEVEKLAVRYMYNGTDQIHTANGTGTNIRHIGQSTILTPNRNLHHHNILHVLPQRKILFLFTALHLIRMSFLNFIPTSFSSRIGT